MYRLNMQRMISKNRNLDFLEGEVDDIDLSEDRVQGVTVKGGLRIPCSKVVLTTGTFLGGTLFFGNTKTAMGGRFGDATTSALSKRLRAANFQLGRLKTGTPPRLLGSSIDYDGLVEQTSDANPTPFSFLNATIDVDWEMQKCHMTFTNPKSHEIILNNLHHSPYFESGEDGKGFFSFTLPLSFFSSSCLCCRPRSAILPFHRAQGAALW